MGRKPESPNLINERNTIASDPAQMRFTPGSIMSHTASQPMTHRHDITHSQPATQPIRLRYIQ